MTGGFSCASGARRLAAAAIGAVLLLASAWPAIAADPQAGDAALRGYLDAGEFGPAMELARGAPTAIQRDAWPGQIAVAQAGLGARQSSLASAGEIGSDQARADTLSRGAATSRWARRRRRAGRFRLADRPDYIHTMHPGRTWAAPARSGPSHRRDHRSARGASSAAKERIRRAVGGPA